MLVGEGLDVIQLAEAAALVAKSDDFVRRAPFFARLQYASASLYVLKLLQLLCLYPVICRHEQWNKIQMR